MTFYVLNPLKAKATSENVVTFIVSILIKMLINHHISK